MCSFDFEDPNVYDIDDPTPHDDGGVPGEEHTTSTTDDGGIPGEGHPTPSDPPIPFADERSHIHKTDSFDDDIPQGCAKGEGCWASCIGGQNK